MFAREPIAKLDHLPELPGRVDVKQRERKLAGMERLLGEVHHHARVLADAVEHDGIVELGGDLPQDVDALRLELAKVSQPLARDEEVVNQDRCRHQGNVAPNTSELSRMLTWQKY